MLARRRSIRGSRSAGGRLLPFSFCLRVIDPIIIFEFQRCPDDKRDEKRQQNRGEWFTPAGDLPVLLGLRQLLASIRQGGLQLLSTGFDLVFHAAKIIRSGAEFAFEAESERVNLPFDIDTGLGRNASTGIVHKVPLQIAPPFEQPFRLGASDGRNPPHFFDHIGGCLDAVREQCHFYGWDNAFDLGVLDLKLIEELVELILSRFGFQLLKLKLPDLRQIFVSLFPIQQLKALCAPAFIPAFTVVLLSKALRHFFRLPKARLNFLSQRVLRNRLPTIKERLQVTEIDLSIIGKRLCGNRQRDKQKYGERGINYQTEHEAEAA